MWILEIEEWILITWKLKEMTELGCEAMWKTFAQNGRKKKAAATAERSGTCITLFEEERVIYRSENEWDSSFVKRGFRLHLEF